MTKQGYGPLKTESQETSCVLDQKDDVATQSKAKKQ
jgi:hypothetical protein